MPRPACFGTYPVEDSPKCEECAHRLTCMKEWCKAK